MSISRIMKSIMEKVKEDTFDYSPVLTLQQYKVTIACNSNIYENRGYIFTPSTIDASPEERANFQRAIDFMVYLLINNPDYILLYKEE